jgi:hypothetical protein
MPDSDLTVFEDVWNKLVNSGTDLLRDVNAREQAQSALANGIREVLDKAATRQPGAEKYKSEFARGVAAAVFEIEPVDQAMSGAQSAILAVADYLERRLQIPANIRSAADSVAGKTISDPELAAVRSTVAVNGAAANDLDDKLRLKVKQEFSFKPSVVLDPTINFVQNVDAAYDVVITRADTTVRLRAGVSIERPLSSAAAVSGVASARVNEGRLSGYIRTTTRISDLYGRNNVSGSSIGGGVAWQLSPNTTLNLDYSARDIYGPGAEPEQEVFFGIKIRF